MAASVDDEGSELRRGRSDFCGSAAGGTMHAAALEFETNLHIGPGSQLAAWECDAVM